MSTPRLWIKDKSEVIQTTCMLSFALELWACFCYTVLSIVKTIWRILTNKLICVPSFNQSLACCVEQEHNFWGSWDNDSPAWRIWVAGSFQSSCLRNSKRYRWLFECKIECVQMTVHLCVAMSRVHRELCTCCGMHDEQDFQSVTAFCS